MRRLFAALLPLAGGTGIHKEIFTSNAVCSAKNCVNPIFPGLEDLYTLSKEQFSCQTLQDVAKSLDFCKGVVNYNPSLPKPASEKTVAELVREQEQRAMTSYFVHLNAMGLEAWDYSHPANSGDICAESVWRLACYTYFPKTPRDCAKNADASYIRPCQSSCQNYIRQCAVECCDESVQCSFEHTKKLDSNTTISTFGYVPHDGPSMFCTGSGLRVSGFGAPILLAVFIGFWGVLGQSTPMGVVSVSRSSSGRFFTLLTLGLFAQGAKGLTLSDVSAAPAEISSTLFLSNDTAAPRTVLAQVGTSTHMAVGTGAAASTGLSSSTAEKNWVSNHGVGNWRSKPDYLIKFQYIPPGGSAKGALLNSCSLQNLAQTLQCSGRGVCKPFDPNNMDNPLSFCHCDRDYADPECRTKRRSQATAYLLSLFLGMFGIDKFYLGFPAVGAAKLVSFGGFGLWWVADVVHTGSQPIYASAFRVADNLPHWVFVLATISFFVALGFLLAACTTASHRRKQRRSALLFQAEADARPPTYTGPAKHEVRPPQPQIQFPPPAQ